MEELFQTKLSLLREYLALSREHARILASDDLERLGDVLKSKTELINRIKGVDKKLSGYRRQDALPLVADICDEENGNISLTQSKMHEITQQMQEIDKRKTMIDRYAGK